MSEQTPPTPKPITPEQLDELVDTDPLQLRDAAAALLTQRDNARADAKRVRVIAGNLQKLIEELRADWQRLHAELAQMATATTYLQGPEECLERECEEYFDDHGNERPGVEYCSHLKAKRLTVDEHLAALSERDDVVAELEEERLTGDALRKDRDQIHSELTAARAALAEERARHGELVAEMQRARTEAERRRDELDALTDRLDVAVTHAAADRHNSAAEARALRQENTTLRAEQVRLAEQVRVLAGLLRRGNPKVFCSKHPDHVEPGCEVCRDAGIFRSALGEQDGDQTDG